VTHRLIPWEIAKWLHERLGYYISAPVLYHAKWRLSRIFLHLTHNCCADYEKEYSVWIINDQYSTTRDSHLAQFLMMFRRQASKIRWLKWTTVCEVAFVKRLQPSSFRTVQCVCWRKPNDLSVHSYFHVKYLYGINPGDFAQRCVFAVRVSTIIRGFLLCQYVPERLASEWWQKKRRRCSGFYKLKCVFASGPRLTLLEYHVITI